MTDPDDATGWRRQPGTGNLVPMTPGQMRRLADRLRRYAATLTDARRVRKYRRRAAWWEDQAERKELGK